MMAARDKKRHYLDPQPPSDSNNPNKKPKLQNFPSYLETPNLSPKLKLLCEIIATTPSASVEKLLDETGIRVSREDVEQILKLSYSFPGPAVKFFRWSGRQLSDKLSPYAWNLVVDLLGKNSLFDAMWDAIKSMRRTSMVSLATFASVFSSYVMVDRVKDVIMTFDVMDQYGVARDIIALNSLLSAICQGGRTTSAVEFLRIAKERIRPDTDTYAILLEGWETEGDKVGARGTFSDMVCEIGWNPQNVPAYTSFLCTLVKGRAGVDEAIKFFVTMIERGCCPGIKFFEVAMEECLRTCDVRAAEFLWESMLKICVKPDISMYNNMIALYCYSNKIDAAKSIFDDMVCNGAFPDTQTYNIMFQFFLKIRKLREASVLFKEMIKNECIPNQANCIAAIRNFMDAGEVYMAIKVWKCMLDNHDSDLEETGNFLVVGLRDLDMIPEAVKYAELMIEKGIRLASSSMSKLKQRLYKAGKESVYEDLSKKWKAN
ncbi:putative pentatricopeptide repeat-containing protein [Tripterygium wilfordii]|uniref:Putative pentatricopeptide repeat-containing protein n=1 Tax=Tripterygium wilfordii TaxID=458696 RepID=A0A7J7DCP7_TRIWF|nr:pentatricopeptide repeat-containing protein At1g77360, mitochondrial-like isoform X1 [Tripterygium wilfordii]XP_038708191.1 pentatricopeptide repeat-containing protein At1g77360, mitochondrial-like isoform X1 [Tripterygium wilfordii]KAF5744091.1 putative pentatricopeptide repeat-containing protein [Tripterygium wilfordii]